MTPTQITLQRIREEIEEPLRTRIAELEAALRFYADEASWRQAVPATDLIPVLDDWGERARIALGMPTSE